MVRALSIALAIGLAGSGVAMAKTLRGTERNDTLVGTPAADVIYASGGDDSHLRGPGQ